MFQIFDKMPALKSKKSVGLAFLIGLFFGSIGLSIYLHSFFDLWVPIIVFIIAVPAQHPLGFLIGFVFAGFWGMMRVLYSNKNFENQ